MARCEDFEATLQQKEQKNVDASAFSDIRVR